MEKNKIIILNDKNDNTDEVLKHLKKDILDIEILEITLEELNIIKNVLNKDNRAINYIMEKLNLLGIPNDKVGYKYIIDAVFLWDKYNIKNNLNITFIYKKLAIKYDKRRCSIEKAIRKCIEYSFTYGNLDELNKLCLRDISIHTGKISNKKFISKLAQYLKGKEN